jgi:GT2 family glycosyltransferase
MKGMTDPGKGTPELSVIIVNYNDRTHLPACLSSLEKALSGLSAEVVLIDNQSEDGSLELVRSSFPWVRLIENERNVGYPRANNIGFRQSRGEYVLFLNTDTVMPADAPASLLAGIKARPQIAGVGPALIHEDGSFQVSFGNRRSFFSELCQKLILNPYYKRALQRSRKPRAAGWLSGACLLARRAAVEAAGLFDEAFFFYFEDIDLCRRISDRGYELVFLPAVHVFHVGGATTSTRPWPSRLEYRRSQLRFYKKHNSRFSLALIRLYLKLIILALVPAIKKNEAKARYRQGLKKILAG